MIQETQTTEAQQTPQPQQGQQAPGPPLMMVPTLPRDEAERFSRVWTFNGVAVTMDNASLQFATDFANTAIRSFVQAFMKLSIQKPIDGTTEKPKDAPKTLIVEG